MHNRSSGLRKQCCICNIVMEEQIDYMHQSLGIPFQRRVCREHLLNYFLSPFYDLRRLLFSQL